MQVTAMKQYNTVTTEFPDLQIGDILKWENCNNGTV
jgi:hypothetical protein